MPITVTTPLGVNTYDTPEQAQADLAWWKSALAQGNNTFAGTPTTQFINAYESALGQPQTAPVPGVTGSQNQVGGFGYNDMTQAHPMDTGSLTNPQNQPKPYNAPVTPATSNISYPASAAAQFNPMNQQTPAPAQPTPAPQTSPSADSQNSSAQSSAGSQPSTPTAPTYGQVIALPSGQRISPLDPNYDTFAQQMGIAKPTVSAPTGAVAPGTKEILAYANPATGKSDLYAKNADGTVDYISSTATLYDLVVKQGYKDTRNSYTPPNAPKFQIDIGGETTAQDIADSNNPSQIQAQDTTIEEIKAFDAQSEYNRLAQEMNLASEQDKLTVVQDAIRQVESDISQEILNSQGEVTASQKEALIAQREKPLRDKETTLLSKVQNIIDRIKLALGFGQQTFENQLAITDRIQDKLNQGISNELDIAKLVSDLPVGQTVTVGGKKYTGTKQELPDIYTVNKEDANGNVTVVGIDKNTGETIYTTNLGRIGTPSSGGSSGGGTSIVPQPSMTELNKILTRYPSDFAEYIKSIYGQVTFKLTADSVGSLFQQWNDPKSSQMITPATFLDGWGRDALYSVAIKNGYTENESQKEYIVNQFVLDLMKRVQAYRDQGYKDSEILKMMQ